MDDQRRCTIILTCRRQDLLRNVMNSQKEIQIDALSKEEALQLFKKLMFNIPNVADLEKKMEETVQEGPVAISLPYGGIQVLPERLQCPCLELLHTEGDGSLQVSDHFFKGTEGLKVLNFTRIHFSSLPSSLGCLINLQTLCLDYCRLKDIAIVGQLKKLEILSLVYSDIKQLPLEIGRLTRLQLLDLSNCWSLELIPPNVISKLSRLEELFMHNSFSQWDKVEGGSNASLVELKGLSKLTTLEIHVSDSEILPLDFVSVELERYKIYIGQMSVRWLVESKTSTLMVLKGPEQVSLLLGNDGTKMLLKRTEDLRLYSQKGVQNIVHELDDGEGFPRLKHLHVKSCYEILHIVGSVRREEGELYHREGNLNSTIQKCYIEMIGFRDIENIKLSLFPRLKEIWHNQALPVSFFNNLRHLVLDDCKNMSSAIPANLIRCLNNLASLEVRNCDSLEEVLHLEELNADKEHLCPLFPKLFSLRLIDLPKLKRFCNFTGNIIELLELEYLTIENCPDMETFTSNST
ncbi:hypothetical protein CUMW_249360 [Citrus unshiu]|uniref:Uncharacterized protein n=1 Tax=Citrus unshiu TaxID=55188 RepID=A0A2H5QPG9_CITUN|nr:hypothetical protein CUMW_249360 [Citrus unshiu]